MQQAHQSGFRIAGHSICELCLCQRPQVMAIAPLNQNRIFNPVNCLRVLPVLHQCLALLEESCSFNLASPSAPSRRETCRRQRAPQSPGKPIQVFPGKTVPALAWASFERFLWAAPLPGHTIDVHDVVESDNSNQLSNIRPVDHGQDMKPGLSHSFEGKAQAVVWMHVRKVRSGGVATRRVICQNLFDRPTWSSMGESEFDLATSDHPAELVSRDDRQGVLGSALELNSARWPAASPASTRPMVIASPDVLGPVRPGNDHAEWADVHPPGTRVPHKSVAAGVYMK